MTYLLLLSMTLVVAGGVSDNLAVCYRCTTRRACHFFDSLGIAYLLDGQEPASTRVASFPALVDLEFSIGIFKSSHSLQHHLGELPRDFETNNKTDIVYAVG